MLTDNNFGVIILSPNANTGNLKYTTTSLKDTFPGCKHVAVIGNNARDIDIDSLSKFCQVYKGGRTITSLIDAGMSFTLSEWCLIIMSGSVIRYPVMKKYRYFSEDKAILFPVIDRKYLFDEASISGILMRKKVYEDVGPFGDDVADIKSVKLFWAARALEKGYKFKALVGVRFL